MYILGVWELKVIYIWELLVKTNLEGYAIYTSTTTVMTYNAVPAQVSKNSTQEREHEVQLGLLQSRRWHGQ